MIIGNKEEFAVQIENPKSERTKIALWINNLRIGNYIEEEYSKIVYNQLYRLTNLKIDKYTGDFNLISVDLLIRDEETIENQIILSLGESFDDFCIRIMFAEQKIYFFWKLNDKPFGGYDAYDKKYKNRTFKKEISWFEYELVLKEFIKSIS
ncbi:MAG: hypothetical protein R2798_07720 [Chitinophagales bacterium]|nr:hypothetical protein [Bacteroidota bacterium]